MLDRVAEAVSARAERREAPIDRMREHILLVADRLFYGEGIRAVSMDRIIASANVAKATMYRHFPTKDALILAYLHRRNEVVTGAMRRALEAAGTQAAGTARVARLFDWLETRVLDAGFRGCTFVLAAGEYGHDEQVRRIVIAHKNALIDMLKGALEASLQDRHPELAQELACVYEGAISEAMVRGDPVVVRRAARIAQWLLEGPRA